MIPYITQVAVSKLKEFGIFEYNTHDGTTVRDYIHVADLELGHVKALAAMWIGKFIFWNRTGLYCIRGY